MRMSRGRCRAGASAAAVLLTGMLVGFGAAARAQAGSCLVPDSDVARIDSAAQRTRLSIGHTALKPCQGRVNAAASGADGGISVLYSTGGGLIKEALVTAGKDLRDVVPQRLIDIAEPGTIVGSVWRVLSGSRPLRTASKRFDERDGLMLGGQVLEGRDLRLPLAAFGWEAETPVFLHAPGKPPRALPMAGGTLALPVVTLGRGKFRLVQGRRETQIEIVGADNFDGLASGLREIETGPVSSEIQALRLTYLFWEQGLQLNAIAADARR